MHLNFKLPKTKKKGVFYSQKQLRTVRTKESAN